jgi:hypothetical protein
VLINKARLAIGKNPNPVFSFFAAPSSSSQTHLGFLCPTPASMANASGSCLNLGAPVEKRGHGHPRGSKNKASTDAVVASSSALVKRRPGHPAGSKNKPKVPLATPGPSTPSANMSSPPPRLFSFFCITGPQCREIQRLPLNFTKFMDGRELREAVLREHSGGGAPYEVEVWYDGAGEQYFKGGWSQFAEDHDLHQCFFMTFDFHVGTSKFDMKVYDCTQCQKEYEAEVHFH